MYTTEIYEYNNLDGILRAQFGEFKTTLITDDVIDSYCDIPHRYGFNICMQTNSYPYLKYDYTSQYYGFQFNSGKANWLSLTSCNRSPSAIGVNYLGNGPFCFVSNFSGK